MKIDHCNFRHRLFRFRVEQVKSTRGKCRGYTSVSSSLRYLKLESVPGSSCINAAVSPLGICQYLMHDYNWLPLKRFNDTTSPAVAEDELNIVPRVNQHQKDHRIPTTQTGTPR